MRSVIDELKRQREAIDTAIRVLEGAPLTPPAPIYQPVPVYIPTYTPSVWPQTWCDTTSAAVMIDRVGGTRSYTTSGVQ